MFSEVAEIALVAARLGQFRQLLKTRVILILNFTRPHAITYTNSCDILTWTTETSYRWNHTLTRSTLILIKTTSNIEGEIIEFPNA